MSGKRFNDPAKRIGGDSEGPRFRLSLLDRLLADQAVKGDGGAAVEKGPRVTPEIARRGIERDLEMLLSTRQRHIEWPQHLDLIATSNGNYGIADYSGRNLTLRHIQEEFRKSVEATIKIFEPRLGRVAVYLADSSTPTDPQLQFRIEGVMFLDSEPVSFDTTLDPVTYNVTVRTAG